MPGTKISFDDVRKIALALPEVAEATAWGTPALKVRGKLMACLPIHKSAERDSLAVMIDIEQRAGLLADAPETYYVTGHYINHPVVLVRLAKIRRDELRDLLSSSWQFVTAQGSRAGAVIRGRSERPASRNADRPAVRRKRDRL